MGIAAGVEPRQLSPALLKSTKTARDGYMEQAHKSREFVVNPKDNSDDEDISLGGADSNAGDIRNPVSSNEL